MDTYLVLGRGSSWSFAAAAPPLLRIQEVESRPSYQDLPGCLTSPIPMRLHQRHGNQPTKESHRPRYGPLVPAFHFDFGFWSALLCSGCHPSIPRTLLSLLRPLPSLHLSSIVQANLCLPPAVATNPRRLTFVQLDRREALKDSRFGKLLLLLLFHSSRLSPPPPPPSPNPAPDSLRLPCIRAQPLSPWRPPSRSWTRWSAPSTRAAASR